MAGSTGIPCSGSAFSSLLSLSQHMTWSLSLSQRAGHQHPPRPCAQPQGPLHLREPALASSAQSSCQGLLEYSVHLFSLLGGVGARWARQAVCSAVRCGCAVGAQQLWASARQLWAGGGWGGKQEGGHQAHPLSQQCPPERRRALGTSLPLE